MDPWVQVLTTIVCSLLASAGFWSFVGSKVKGNDASVKLLIGLAHDRICYLGMQYIDRGYITQDEYENLHDYLYLPYVEKGGNGSAKRIMQEVEKLEIRHFLDDKDK
ncbi:MAG: hypothetical protein LUF78_10875 [Clostridiales bacterium]|nr:hypothetical protein [Clostridiales bacterium]